MTDEPTTRSTGSFSLRQEHAHLLRSNLADVVSERAFSTCFTILAVLHLGFSGTQIGLVNSAGSLAFLLFAVPLGSWVERRGGVRVLGGAYAAKVAIMIVAVLLYLCGLLATSLALMLVLGIVTVASENAQTTASAALAGR